LKACYGEIFIFPPAPCSLPLICFIPTGSSASAAKNAALRAILRILPPMTLSLANFSKSKSAVETGLGN
ncbi:MAG: hypothetical protein ACRAVC_26445, partial [Trichormus sp.]